MLFPNFKTQYEDLETLSDRDSTRRDFITRKWNATIYLKKGFGADSVSLPSWPGNEQILAERSAGGPLSLPRQEVLSPLVEGGVWVVEGAWEMIKKNNEVKHHFWMGWDVTKKRSTGTDWMNGMLWVKGRQRRGWTERDKARMTRLSLNVELQ